MSVGRIPELMLAGLIIGALLLIGLWVQAGERKAQTLFWQEGRAAPRDFDLAATMVWLKETIPTGPPRGRSVEDRLRRLYPSYAWRLALMRLRLHRLTQMVGIRQDTRLRVPPLGILLWPALAEAVRRRAIKQSSPVSFPNEIAFQLGLWLLVLGTAGLAIGYVLSPVVISPGLFLVLLVGLIMVGLIALVANTPGRWRRDD